MTQPVHDKITRILQDRTRLRHPGSKALHALLTAVPTPGSSPKAWSPLGVLARDLGWLVLGLFVAGVSAALMPAAGFAAPLLGLVLFAGQALIVGRLRRLVVGHTHEATHGVIAKWYQAHGVSRAKSRRLGEAVLDLGSAISLTLNGQDYRRKHGPHHGRHLGTLRDPDGAMLAAWGLWPGKLRFGFYTTLVLMLLDPRWHLARLGDRLASNLLRGRPYRRLLGLAVLAALLAPLAVLPVPVWLAMIGLPWTVGLQIAGALQSITEHEYGYDAPAADLEAYVARSWQRYPYRPMPQPGLSGLRGARAWSAWTLAIAGHALVRTAIYDDGMVHHAHHHNSWPQGVPFYDWWNTAHRYMAWRQAHPEGDERAVWGLIEALRRQKARMTRPD